MQLLKDDPLAQEVTRAIQTGDTQALATLLSAHEGLATCRIATERTLLHIATDWPGHFPRVAETIHLLVKAGADVNAPFLGKHAETPLHWAASSNDITALDALIDAGADLEAPGAVLGGGPPLADAVGFGCTECARRLIERGAKSTRELHA